MTSVPGSSSPCHHSRAQKHDIGIADAQTVPGQTGQEHAVRWHIEAELGEQQTRGFYQASTATTHQGALNACYYRGIAVKEGNEKEWFDNSIPISLCILTMFSLH